MANCVSPATRSSETSRLSVGGAVPAAIPKLLSMMEDRRAERVSQVAPQGMRLSPSSLRQLSQERISSLQVQTEILGNGLSRICQAGSRAQVGTLRNA